MSLILSTARFAREKHDGQFRKYNNRPYITHPCRVAARTAAHELATDELVAAAFLHDVVEDCGVLLPEIESRFGRVVCEYVDHLTNRSKSSGLPRHERKKLDRERISGIPAECKVVKLIDRIDNLRELNVSAGGSNIEFCLMYAKESALLLQVLSGVDSELESELAELANEFSSASDVYLLQCCSVGYLGNSPLFWKQGGSGYTAWIDEAKRWTLEEANKQVRSTRESHSWKILRLVDIERFARRTVDIQDLGGK